MFSGQEQQRPGSTTPDTTQDGGWVKMLLKQSSSASWVPTYTDHLNQVVGDIFRNTCAENGLEVSISADSCWNNGGSYLDLMSHIWISETLLMFRPSDPV
ncbi:hypothetical protein ILYODFUR_028703 [Ilyodon furcidens]|uniref:Uncharacterized protein n=1 Tax=Ilyodon furcidens TaxID=33524 RepID=A0ABV0TZ35_9TELE